FSRDWSSDVCSSDLQVTPDARDVREIGGLAIPVRQAPEDAEQLRVPLRAEHGVGLVEGRRIKARLSARDLVAIVSEQIAFDIFQIGRASCRETGET